MNTFTPNETWNVSQRAVQHLARPDHEQLHLNEAKEDELIEGVRKRTNRIRNEIEPGTHKIAGSAFADLMLHPEKLEQAFKNAQRENELFEISRKFNQSAAKCY